MNIKNILCCFVLLSASVLAFSVDFSRELRLSSPRMNGDDVAELQKRLMSFGFAAIGSADGWFGPLTDKAVKSYQELLGFKRNGVVDKELWNVLFSNESTLLRISSDIRIINSYSISQYDKQETDVFGRSAEGGSMTLYRDKGELKYAEVDLYGETGKVYNKAYFVEDRSVVIQTYYHYPEPFDVEHATIEISTYYYQGKSTYELRDGSLKEVKYDDPGVMDIIKSK